MNPTDRILEELAKAAAELITRCLDARVQGLGAPTLDIRQSGVGMPHASALALAVADVAGLYEALAAADGRVTPPGSPPFLDRAETRRMRMDNQIRHESKAAADRLAAKPLLAVERLQPGGIVVQQGGHVVELRPGEAQTFDGVTPLVHTVAGRKPCDERTPS